MANQTRSNGERFTVSKQAVNTAFVLQVSNRQGKAGTATAVVKQPSDKLVHLSILMGRKHRFTKCLQVTELSPLLKLPVSFKGKNFVLPGRNGTQLIIDSVRLAVPRDSVHLAQTNCRKGEKPFMSRQELRDEVL